VTSVRRIPPSRDDELLTTDEVAVWLKVSPRTLREWRYLEAGPAWIALEGGVRYRTSAVAAYLASLERPNTVLATGRGFATRQRSRAGAVRP